MPSQRELDLIIKLRKSNTGELKRLDNEIKKFHENVKKGSEQIGEGYRKASKDIVQLRSEIFKASKSTEGFASSSKSLEKNLSSVGKKTAEVYSSLIRNTKRLKEMVQQLARSTLDEKRAAEQAGLSTEKYSARLKKLFEQYSSLHRSSQKYSSELEKLYRTEKIASKEIDLLNNHLGIQDTSNKKLSSSSKTLAIAIRETGSAAEEAEARMKAFSHAERAVLSSVLDTTGALKIQGQEMHKLNMRQLTNLQKTQIVAASMYKLFDVLNGVAPKVRSIATEMYSLGQAGNKTIEVTNRLTKALREIQVSGSFKGVSIFEQNIQSAKLFMKELEKLRLRLAEVRGERVYSRASVTAGMTKDFDRLSKEIEKASEQANFFRESLKRLSALRDEFYSLQKSMDGPSRKLRDMAKNMEFFSGKSAGEINQIILSYAELREHLIKVFNDIGIKTTKGAAAFSTFQKKISQALKIIFGELDKLGTAEERLEAIQKKALIAMENNLKYYANVSTKTWTREVELMQANEKFRERTESSLKEMEAAFKSLMVVQDKYNQGLTTYAVLQEAATRTMEKANEVMKVGGSTYQKLAKETYKSAEAALSSRDPFDSLSETISELNTKLSELAKKEKALGIEARVLGGSKTFLQKKVSFLSEKSRALSETISILSNRMAVLDLKSKDGAAAWRAYEKELERVSAILKITNASLRSTEAALRRVELKAGDSTRAMGRMSSEGFADMIISQAAWMAGFMLMFGMFERFNHALGEVTENQKAVARAMRTIRSDTETQAQMYKRLTDSVNEMRASVGASAEETGEALYQLGSAGLKLEESLAALKPTMDTIIGSEADMEQITNLVAGLYNNFGDQIVKIDGKVRTISNTFDGYNDHLVTSASLTEKFTRLNDILIRTFDAHQAEMDQIRDGMKFMAQSARNANLSLEEQLAILALLHDHLIKAGAAGRGMRVILSRITKEAALFKEEFDLNIDLNAPLDVLDIFKQLHEQLKDNILTVGELGDFFKRLGLRGVEPALAMIQYYDQFDDILKDIKENSENAAKAMRETRLGNLADQAKIASERLNVLIIKGLEPLVGAIGTVVEGFNKLTSFMKDSSGAISSFVGWLAKLAGFIGLVVAIQFSFKNLGSVLIWIKDVFRYLAIKMREFQAEIIKVNEASKQASISVKGLGASMNLVGNSASAAATKVTGFGRVLKVTTGFVKTFGATILTMVAFDLIYQAIDYIANYEERVQKTIDSLKKQAREHEVNAQNLQKINEKLNASERNTDAFTKSLERAISQLGMSTEEFNNQDEALQKVNEEMKILIENQKKLAQDKLEKSMWEELDKVSVSLMKMNLFQKDVETGFRGIYQAAAKGIPMGEALYAAWVTSVRLLNGEERVLLETLEEQRSKSAELAEHLDVLGEIRRKAVSPDLIAKTDKLIEKVREEKTAIDEEIKTLEKRRAEVTRGNSSMEEMLKVQEENNKRIKESPKYIKDLNRSLEEATELKNEFKELGAEIDQIEKYLNEAEAAGEDYEKVQKNIIKSLEAGEKSLEKYSKGLSRYKKEVEDLTEKFREDSKSIEIFTQAFAPVQRLFDSGSTSAKEYANALSESEVMLKKLSDSSMVEEFTQKTEKLSDAFNKVAASRTHGGFKEILKDLVVLQKEGGSALEHLKKKLITLINELDKLEGKKFTLQFDSATRSIDYLMNKLPKLREELDAIEKSGDTGDRYKKMAEIERISERINKRTKTQTELIKQRLESLASKYEELMRKANDPNLSEEQRAENLREAERILGQLEAIREKEIQTIERQQAAEEALKRIQLERMGYSEESIKKLMSDISEKYDRAKDKVFDALEDITKKQVEVLNKMDKLGPQSIKNVQTQIEAIQSAMEKIKNIASAGIQMETRRIKDAQREVEELGRKLKEVFDRTYKIKVDSSNIDDTKKKLPQGGSYWGGEIKRASGGLVPVRVTSGEGYFSPSFTKDNISVLNALNSGMTVKRVPETFGKFVGPSGVDNIHTYLPSGSYVLSKRGVETYERSVKKGAQTFQQGGEVGSEEEATMMTTGTLNQESMGTFTIVVEKEGRSKEFPISGKVSVLQGLKDELEEDRLTRLH